MSTPKVYRTDDLPDGPERTPEQQAEFEAGQAEARAKMGDAASAERVARERLAKSGTQRGSITGGGYGATKRSAN